MEVTTLFPAKNYIYIPGESEDSDEDDDNNDDDDDDDDDGLANRRKWFTKTQIEEIHSHQITFLDDFPNPDLKELYTVATFMKKLAGWVLRSWHLDENMRVLHNLCLALNLCVIESRTKLVPPGDADTIQNIILSWGPETILAFHRDELDIYSVIESLQYNGSPVYTAAVHHPVLGYLIEPMTVVLKSRDIPAKPGEDSPPVLKPATDPGIWKNVLDTVVEAHDLCGFC